MRSSTAKRWPSWALQLVVCGCQHTNEPETAITTTVGVPVTNQSTVLVGDGAFGDSVFATTDVSGDGTPDLVVGGNAGGQTNNGALYVFCGPITTNLTVSAACASVDGVNTFAFGWSVTVAADLDGDGQKDLVASDGINYPDSGMYVFSTPILGGWSTADASAVISDDGRTDGACTQLASMSDMDRDGYDELIVAQPRNAGQGGVLYSLDGPLTGEIALGDVADRIEATSSQDLGWSVANVGDTDGDGVDDLLAGVDIDSGYTPIGGGAWLFRGPIRGFEVDTDADLIVRSAEGGAQAGWSISAADDMDMDGLADFWVGTLDEDETPGGAYLFLGGSSGLALLGDASAAVLAEEPEDTDNGISIAGLGDVDGDGRPDLGIGTPADDEAGEGAGAVWLVSGPIEGTQRLGETGAKFVGTARGDQLGEGVSRGTDLDGDGVANPVVWAQGYDAYAGALYLMNGLGQ